MKASGVEIRQTREEDLEGIIALSREVYPHSPPWTKEQLLSHLRVFPQGQLVAVAEGKVVGMAASLIVHWEDYDAIDSWKDFTAGGMFTNHDPEKGHTLYGAEVMVSPSMQGCGVGSKLYAGRRRIAQREGVLRIRAGARLRGYHHHAGALTPREYVQKVVDGELKDPTLSFQLRHGFRVIDVVSGYLRSDPESLGFAAVIEWLTPKGEQQVGHLRRGLTPKKAAPPLRVKA